MFSEKQNYESCGQLGTRKFSGWWEEEEGQGLWLPLPTTLQWSGKTQARANDHSGFLVRQEADLTIWAGVLAREPMGHSGKVHPRTGRGAEPR